MPARRVTRLVKWLIAAVLAVVVLAVAGAFVYIHFIQGPAPKQLTLGPTAPAGSALTAKEVDGKWTVGAGSEAGYRVQEVLAGQNNTAVGRGTGVTGSLELVGNQVKTASFTVNLTTVVSDSGQRDAQFNGRIMDTAQFPNATFTLTKPITLRTLPRVNQTINVSAVGTLNMHGVTKPVTATMQARDTGSSLQITGQIPVTFATWNIDNPSFSGFVKTENHGLVEFLLKTTKS